MRISDWSSDVCSSDLGPFSALRPQAETTNPTQIPPNRPKRKRRNHLSGSARSEEHTSELQSLMRISYAVFCLKKKTQTKTNNTTHDKTSQINKNKHTEKKHRYKSNNQLKPQQE